MCKVQHLLSLDWVEHGVKKILFLFLICQLLGFFLSSIIIRDSLISSLIKPVLPVFPLICRLFLFFHAAVTPLRLFYPHKSFLPWHFLVSLSPPSFSFTTPLSLLPLPSLIVVSRSFSLFYLCQSVSLLLSHLVLSLSLFWLILIFSGVTGWHCL